MTINYRNDNGRMIPLRVHTVVISTQHADNITNEFIRKELMEKIVKTTIPHGLLDKDTVRGQCAFVLMSFSPFFSQIYHLNPSGRFVIGGPQGDAGLTGRKIIVDSYGGWGAHGGGAFSGKDPTKVDRSGAYAARWVAKSLVKAGLAKRVLVQVAYAIGVAKVRQLFVCH